MSFRIVIPSRGGVVLLLVLVAWCPREARAQAVKRALLIGINDYSASRVPPVRDAKPPDRDWANLDGAVNDVHAMRDLLTARYDFATRSVVTITDHEATRAAILQAIETHLVRPARRGDILLFYYSGHGSQVRNSKSDEADKLDESLVPADARAGAGDIRDKELRDLFNRVLDRGARLTVILDACHSGSGARGRDGHRALAPDRRDVSDGSRGPRPEDRGALVLSASADFEPAFETLDDEGRIRGAFSWALARAMRDSKLGEPAADTFVRAEARLRAERPDQVPLLAGNAQVRFAPFLDVATDARRPQPVVAVEKKLEDGTYVVSGGWVTGVNAGSELRVAGTDVKLEVTSLIGLNRATARLARSNRATSLPVGTLLTLAAWAPPPGRPLRVWMPEAPDELARAIGDADGIERTTTPRGADYTLVRRSGAGGIEYSWIRPVTRGEGRARDVLPAQTAWVPAEAPVRLRDALSRLRRIHGWHELSSPPGVESHYRLAIRRATDGSLVEDGVLPGERSYRLVLRAREPLPSADVYARYVYVFVIDSDGEAVLLFPTVAEGSVENRLPLTLEAARPLRDPPAEISLGVRAFRVLPPYGIDTYFLLSTDEPLQSLACLESGGVRGDARAGPLERLLAATSAGVRGPGEPVRTPPTWSIDKIFFKSVPPGSDAR